MHFELRLALEGDVKIEFVNFDRVFHQDERMFAFTFYTGFLKGVTNCACACAYACLCLCLCPVPVPVCWAHAIPLQPASSALTL